MYAINFHNKNNSGLLELLFDDRKQAEKVVKDFEEGLRSTGECTLIVKSKYGVAVLDLRCYSAAVFSDIDATEEMVVALAIRRGRIEHKAKTAFAKWATIRANLEGAAMPHKVS